MIFNVINIFILALITIAVALIALTGLVHTELGPKLGLSIRRRITLMIALGLGVIAFALKMIIIFGFITYERNTDRPSFTPIDKSATTIFDEATSYRWVMLDDIAINHQLTGALNPNDYRWQALPEQAPQPEDNPSNAAKIQLGELLFNDTNLSFDRTISCASCHDLIKAAGADALSTAIGIEQQLGNRNSPTVFNSAFQDKLFWDGRADSLEAQAKGPFLNPVEMGMPTFDLVVERVAEQSHYKPLFYDAFGREEISIDTIAKAIATYERTLITPDSIYDDFVRGNIAAMSEAQIRGMALFAQLGCVQCHSGPNFSSASVFNRAMPWVTFPIRPTPFEKDYDLLIKQPTDKVKIRGQWRVPSLRNVALTGPWLHNGSVTELTDVIRIMASAQLGYSGRYLQWSAKSNTVTAVNQPQLTEQQVADIEAFLHTLSSQRLVKLMSATGNQKVHVAHGE